MKRLLEMLSNAVIKPRFSSSRTRRRRSKAGIGNAAGEILEQRQLLAATISLVGTTLNINGTADSDFVELITSYAANNQVSNWQVTVKTDLGSLNSVTLSKYFVAVDTPIESLNIQTFGGDDSVQLGASYSKFANGVLINVGSGNDIVQGSLGSKNTIYGGPGNDALRGGYFDDTIYGGPDSDYLRGDDGNDTLYGEGGDDWLFGENGDDTLIGASGNDRLYGSWGDDTLVGGGDDDYLEGSHNEDTIYGDEINGTGIGNDTIYGDDPDVTWIDPVTHQAIPSNDTIYAGMGNDVVYGGVGNDIIHGGAGVDFLYGEAGDDEIHGGADGDYLFGQLGVDKIYGDAGKDALYGGDGNDELYGGTDGDWLFGEAGNDLLYGEAGYDWLQGGSGFDIFNGGLDGAYYYDYDYFFKGWLKFGL